MNKGQVTLEFLANFVIYLGLISLILLSLVNYSNSVQEYNSNADKIIEMESVGRILDGYSYFGGKWVVDIGNNKYELWNGTISDKEGIIVETIYSKGGIGIEAT